MKNVTLVQYMLSQYVSVQSENSVYLPLSSASLWAYASQSETIRQSYHLNDLIARRTTVRAALDALPDSDILCMSCYIWNSEFSLEVARQYKLQNPDCLIIAGGPEVPAGSAVKFMENHPWVDVAITGEGEIPFQQLLEAIVEETDWVDIPQIVYRGGDQIIKSRGIATRVDLSEVPSPYSMGLFDHLTNDPTLRVIAIVETNRGCPYSCTFCDWGSLTQSKLKMCSMDRVQAEIDYCFELENLDAIIVTDANFGIAPRDIEIAEYIAMKYRSRDTTRPVGFYTNYAKNQHNPNGRVYQIIRILQDANIVQGVTLSLQTLNTETLKHVDRSNIPLGDIPGMIALYSNAGLSVRIEMMIGLPGETYSTFVDNFDQLMQYGHHDNINVYLTSMLQNSRMSEPDYVQKHGLQSVLTEYQIIDTDDGDAPVAECTEFVIGSNTMTVDEFKRSYLFSSIVQATHYLGPTRFLAKWMHKIEGMAYRDFYEGFIAYFTDTDTVMGRTIDVLQTRIDEFCDQGIYVTRERSGAMLEPSQEGFFQIMSQHNEFYPEMKMFMASLGVHDDELVDYEHRVINYPDTPLKGRITVSRRFWDYDPTVIPETEVKYIGKSPSTDYDTISFTSPARTANRSAIKRLVIDKQRILPL